MQPDPPDKPLNVWRLALLCVAGLAGGVVVGAGLGIIGWMFGNSLGGGVHDKRAVALLFGLYGVPFGFPLGVGTGLNRAGAKLGLRGRFWPTVAASNAGGFVGVGVYLLASRLHLHGTAFCHYLICASPFILALAAGVVGHLISRHRVPGDAASAS